MRATVSSWIWELRGKQTDRLLWTFSGRKRMYRGCGREDLEISACEEFSQRIETTFDGCRTCSEQKHYIKTCNDDRFNEMWLPPYDILLFLALITVSRWSRIKFCFKPSHIWIFYVIKCGDKVAGSRRWTLRFSQKASWRSSHFKFSFVRRALWEDFGMNLVENVSAKLMLNVSHDSKWVDRLSPFFLAVI